jgi:hypothetical protein
VVALQAQGQAEQGRSLSTLAPLRVLRARTPDPAWARRVVDESVRSCPRAWCGKSARHVRFRVSLITWRRRSHTRSVIAGSSVERAAHSDGLASEQACKQVRNGRSGDAAIERQTALWLPEHAASIRLPSTIGIVGQLHVADDPSLMIDRGRGRAKSGAQLLSSRQPIAVIPPHHRLAVVRAHAGRRAAKISSVAGLTGPVRQGAPSRRRPGDWRCFTDPGESDVQHAVDAHGMPDPQIRPILPAPTPRTHQRIAEAVQRAAEVKHRPHVGRLPQMCKLWRAVSHTLKLDDVHGNSHWRALHWPGR